MIVSHRHRFIFVKTIKTGGTSLEIALSKFCGPEDVITPISRDDEETRRGLGFRGPQHYRQGFAECVSRQGLVRGLYRGVQGNLPPRFYNHISAPEIRALVGERTWSDYRTFTVVRNPYDRAISFYYHEKKLAGERGDFPSFADFLRKHASHLHANWEKYTERGAVLVDDLVRYEELGPDLASLSERLGLPENVHDVMKSISAKGSFRPSTAGDRYSLLDDESVGLLSLLCKPEIDLLGYRVPR
ncbi:hypothetical protein Y5W_03386 [Alcanivorax sp. 521-1]|uniref:Sulfotransferase family protein n=1 Tax=Alloalcanivorax profundimaris TaxID=2735259 RepID=A0ABS0AVF0_9GAMM|nr:sulfotransferase family 2 domain-containing protein [Alloalcanivorax profundimaris]MBF5058092.1 hypothetical protein [Alloalcanivorax profundimaris]